MGEGDLVVMNRRSRSRGNLMIQEHRTSWLQLVLVHETEDGDVVLAAHAGGDDRVVVVDDLLQVTHGHRGATEVVNLTSMFSRAGEQKEQNKS